MAHVDHATVDEQLEDDADTSETVEETGVRDGHLGGGEQHVRDEHDDGHVREAFVDTETEKELVFLDF